MAVIKTLSTTTVGDIFVSLIDGDPTNLENEFCEICMPMVPSLGSLAIFVTENEAHLYFKRYPPIEDERTGWVEVV